MSHVNKVESLQNGKENEENDDFFEHLFVGVINGVKGYVSDMMNFQHFNHVNNQAQPGDLVEIQRGYYSHYALYLGKGKVMNVDAEDGTIMEAQICESTLEDVCNGAKARVQNHDQIARTHFQVGPRAVQDIIRTAKSFEGKVIPFQFDFRNCEYYCTLWRYGRGFSTQAAKQGSSPGGKEAGNKNNSNFEADGYAKYKQLANS